MKVMCKSMSGSHSAMCGKIVNKHTSVTNWQNTTCTECLKFKSEKTKKIEEKRKALGILIYPMPGFKRGGK